MVHGKNEEYTAKLAFREALVSFVLRISLGSPCATLIEPSTSSKKHAPPSSIIEARTALATAPLFLNLGVGVSKKATQRQIFEAALVSILLCRHPGLPVTVSRLSPGKPGPAI